MLAARVRSQPMSETEYSEAVIALWLLPHRGEKYIALAYAQAFDDYVGIETLPLFRRLIDEGAWWDLVDKIATKLVGRALENDRSGATPIIWSWISDEDLWMRKASII
jgi:3-methyladenine DNA glycosylase AlkD